MRTTLRGLAQPLRLVKYALRQAGDLYRYAAFRPSHFRGVFETFEQAEAVAPKGKQLGYDHQIVAQSYCAELDFPLSSFDYPVLSHLARILKKDSVVLDFGGNIGLHYRSYAKHLDLENVRWIVCDLPEITKFGRQMCAGVPNITFVNDVSEIEALKPDILLASGSLQYVESPDLLLKKLANSDIQPEHILINRLPLYDGPRFVTLQNGGLVYYPQYVFNHEDFIGAIAGCGYALIDFWDDNVDSCIIPFHAEKSIKAYKGLYFSRKH